ncbi:MAG: ComF family protein [Prevotellaceae bacterium]|jgi:ComF family protein|nr:ComF family protein [Prevotellaceae bacterium]
MIRIVKFIKYFFDLIYPQLCDICNTSLVRGEKLICSGCRIDIPLTRNWNVRGNSVEKIFWGRVPIVAAASYFFFARGSKYRVLLHKLKYLGRDDIGVELGLWFGNELSKCTIFSDVDFIIPVPLHPKKQKSRGYNQSEKICEGLSKAMNKSIDTKTLIRAEFTNTQTKKNRMERWHNVSNVFTTNNAEKLKNKHILLVDDVLTTGATIEACCNAILSETDCRISIVTLAYVS